MNYNNHPPFQSGSDTSKTAADRAAPTAGTIRAQVYDYIRTCGSGGRTDNEIELGLKMLRQTVCARRRELVLSGHIVDSGRRRKTQTGRPSVVWIASYWQPQDAPVPAASVAKKLSAAQLVDAVDRIVNSNVSGLLPDPRISEIKELLSKNRR